MFRRWKALLVSFAVATAIVAVIPAVSAAPVMCNGLTPTHTGTAAGETIKGTANDDVILGLGGADKIYGNGGNDTICGGSGNDVIKGGKGKDWIDGEGGNDKLYGGDRRDKVLGGSGNDLVKGDGDNDVLKGNAGYDSLYGNLGNDVIDGGDETDKIWGGGGDDTLKGGTGADVLRGQAGSDTLIGKGGHDILDGGDGGDLATGGSGIDACYSASESLPSTCEPDQLNTSIATDVTSSDIVEVLYGDVGYFYTRAFVFPSVNGTDYRRGFGFLQHNNDIGDSGWYEFNLGRDYKELAVRVGVLDDSLDSGAEYRFEVIGDDVLLKQVVIGFGDDEVLNVDVSNVLRLRLKVTSTWDTYTDYNYPIWVDPRISANKKLYAAPKA